ncbi:hypothetical protein [Methanococcoides burtonii]|uniref:hypothetical protein n=1 Tax=Methanococcoides burtonii TaxID=29291 RepID=UPI00064FE4B5|nr:hypothetical protein [Methanococcoides burtonii]
MKLNQMFILVLIVSSATFVAFASEDVVIFLTKEDASQSKYTDDLARFTKNRNKQTTNSNN